MSQSRRLRPRYPVPRPSGHLVDLLLAKHAEALLAYKPILSGGPQYAAQILWPPTVTITAPGSTTEFWGYGEAESAAGAVEVEPGSAGPLDRGVPIAGSMAEEDWYVDNWNAYSAPEAEYDLRTLATNDLDALLPNLQAGVGASPANPYRYTTFAAPWNALPAVSISAFLPGSTRVTKRITLAQSGGATVDGGVLLRELTTTTSGDVRWREHWVFADTYRAPGPGNVVQVRYDDRSWATLGAFLGAMSAQAATTAQPSWWRYQRVDLVWGPVPVA